jgi:2-deoxy-D-gluconate 3-dehydrogenase
MVDLSNVFRLCRAAGHGMLTRGSGKIINIASMLSFQGGTRVLPMPRQGASPN